MRIACRGLFAIGLLSISPSLAQTVTQQDLPAGAGWDAALIHRAARGIWYAQVEPVIADHGPPEVIVTCDDGRLMTLSVYSGNWTERSVNPDGQWLAPSRPADVDPRVPGAEIYAGGRGGNVHRITAVREGAARHRLESREIAHIPDEEFHTVLAGDLDTSRAGDELLAFAITGAVFQLDPDLRTGDPGSASFVTRRVATLPGRVRDALIVNDGKTSPRIYGVSRSGHLLSMALGERGLESKVIAHEPMGLGRIARGRVDAIGIVLYVTRDDGVLLRFELDGKGNAKRSVIFVGEQGLRGVVAGRFFAEPGIESVAVYGYGSKVHLVSRRADGPWESTAIFASEDQGHWLSVCELDGRNATDEIIATGFGGQVVLLAREPGYGLDGVAVANVITATSTSPTSTGRPIRLAAKASRAAHELSPLSYQGGFETKSLVYETLVRRGADGRIVPSLASSWTVTEDGRRWSFRLREGATFHDGTTVRADDAAVHFRRWVGLPEHDWLRCNRRIRSVRAVDERTLEIVLDRAYALLPDLCAINPTAIRAPAALDREGAFVRPMGSGPFTFVDVREDGRVLRFARHGAPTETFLDLVRFDKSTGDDPVAALKAGEVDVVIGSWLVRIDPAQVASLRSDPRFRVTEGPGSSMVHVVFHRTAGITSSRAVRRAIAAAIDRSGLVRDVEFGLADASTAWAAPSILAWPRGTPQPQLATPVVLEQPLRISDFGYGGRALAEAIAMQIRAKGLPVEIVGDGSEWDMRCEITHGVPYDPHTTLVSRFLPPDGDRNAERSRDVAGEPALRELVAEAVNTWDETAREAVYAKIQAAMDEDATLVPLYAPRRVAIVRADLPSPTLDHDMYHLDARWLTDG
ncbi:MAG: ABC transporter substrate-binding protein [Planctomycetota bacterium]